MPENKPSRLMPSWWDDPDDERAVDWHIKGVLPDGTMVVIYGGTGSGKTFFTFDMVAHIALGWDWRGLKTKRAGALYVAAEGGSGIWQRRRAFKQRFAPTIGDVPFGVIAASIDLRNPRADTADLIEQIQTAACALPVKVVVIDTLSRALAGGDDTDDMPALVENVDKIRAATGCTVILIHHTGKDASRGTRGAYKLPCDADTVIKVEETDSGNRLATVEKQRDGESGQTFAFRLEKIDLGTDGDGDAITSCVVVPVENAGTTKPNVHTLTERQQLALTALADAINTKGTPAPASNDFPAGVSVISLETWRNVLRSRDIADESDAGRKRFERLKTSLQAAGYIGIAQGLVWVVPKP